jgi:hypothetical protein
MWARRAASTHQPVVVAMADAHLRHAVEIAQQGLPFRREAGFARQVFQCHFCMASARKEQNTCPRIAASDDWKIDRVRITAFGGRLASERSDRKPER